MNRVVIWAQSNYNWLWTPLAERLKRETGATISLICMSLQDAEFFQGMDESGAIDDVVTINHFFHTYDEVDGDENFIIRQARSNESIYGVLAVDLLQTDRHLGRGFSSLAPYYPRSKLSEKASYKNSLNFFNQVLAFWEDYFEERQPDLIIQATANFVGKCCSVVARRRGIKLRELGWARYLDFHTWYTDEYWTYPGLKPAYKALGSAPGDSDDAWSGRLRSFFETWRRSAFTRRSLWVTLWFMVNDILVNFYQRWKGIYKIGNNLLPHQILYHWRKYLDFKRLNACRLAGAEDLRDANYVYCPLHLEPESALSVLSPEFNEQMTVVELIAKNLPAGVKLAVKEHLWAIGRRPPGFYRLLEDIPNVVMVSPTVDSLELSRGSLCVAIITTTAGFEAAAMGIPVITVGLHNCYDFLPHVHVVRSWTALRGLLYRICVEENNPEAKVRRKKDGARLLQAVKSSAMDLAGIDYVSKKRPPASEEEVDRLFAHLMSTLQSGGEFASPVVAREADADVGAKL